MPTCNECHPDPTLTEQKFFFCKNCNKEITITKNDLPYRCTFCNSYIFLPTLNGKVHQHTKYSVWNDKSDKMWYGVKDVQAVLAPSLQNMKKQIEARIEHWKAQSERPSRNDDLSALNAQATAAAKVVAATWIYEIVQACCNELGDIQNLHKGIANHETAIYCWNLPT